MAGKSQTVSVKTKNKNNTKNENQTKTSTKKKKKNQKQRTTEKGLSYFGGFECRSTVACILVFVAVYRQDITEP